MATGGATGGGSAAAGMGKGGAVFINTGATATETNLSFSGNVAANAGTTTTNPQDNNNVFGTLNGTAPSIMSTQVDDGTAQRSMVRGLTLTFSSGVTSVAVVLANLSLTRTDGLVIALSGTLSNNNTVLTLKFTGTSSTASGAIIIGGSLPDGRYTLTYNSTTLLGPGSAGQTDETKYLWRLFGDTRTCRQHERERGSGEQYERATKRGQASVSARESGGCVGSLNEHPPHKNLRSEIGDDRPRAQTHLPRKVEPRLSP